MQRPNGQPRRYIKAPPLEPHHEADDLEENLEPAASNHQEITP
jgi:hypothetical protein